MRVQMSARRLSPYSRGPTRQSSSARFCISCLKKKGPNTSYTRSAKCVDAPFAPTQQSSRMKSDRTSGRIRTGPSSRERNSPTASSLTVLRILSRVARRNSSAPARKLLALHIHRAERGNEVKQGARRVEWKFWPFKAELIEKSIKHRLSEFRVDR